MLNTRKKPYSGNFSAFSFGIVLILLTISGLLQSCSASLRFSTVGNTSYPGSKTRTTTLTPHPARLSENTSTNSGQTNADTEVNRSGVITGHASYYGDEFQGRLTSSGEVFDQDLLTAAHRTLPFGTILRVTNTRNGRSVIVRVNDRGPFVDNRILDLSRAAAQKLDMLREGVAQITIAVLN